MTKFTKINKFHPDNVFTQNEKNFSEWGLKQKFDYFLKKFEKFTGRKYDYDYNKFGLELMSIKRLQMRTSVYKSFISWLVENQKLPSSIFRLKYFKNQFSMYLSKKNGFGFD